MSESNPIAQALFEAVHTRAEPVVNSFDGLRFPNRATKVADVSLGLSHALAIGKLQQHLTNTLNRAAGIAPEERAKKLTPSHVVAWFDAIEVKPGVFGLGIDLKALLLHYVPDLRERLAGARHLPATIESLTFLVSRAGTRVIVEESVARAAPGMSTMIDILIAAGVIRRGSRREVSYVELAHDMLTAAVIEARLGSQL